MRGLGMKIIGCGMGWIGGVGLRLQVSIIRLACCNIDTCSKLSRRNEVVASDDGC
jgi:hypothetical protein